MASLFCQESRHDVFYSLGLAVGISTRASLLFVILQAVFMSNSGFSFYRYYALSSSIIAQLGAVVLIRIIVERTAAGRPMRAAGRRELIFDLLSLGAAGALIVFSHPQALGLALLGTGAAVAATFPRWPRKVRLGAVAAILAANAGVLLIIQLTSQPSLDTLRQQGWLAPWYGFHLLAPWSPAGQRALATLGLAGAVNAMVAVAVARYKPVVAWLTLLPIAALAMPLVAVPLAVLLLKYNPDIGVLTFTRLLFAVPAGLAFAALADLIPLPSRAPASRTGAFFVSGILTLLASVVLLPPRAPAANSAWHFLAVPPADLELKPLREAWSYGEIETATQPSTRLLASSIARDVLTALYPVESRNYFRDSDSVPQLLANTRRAIESVRSLPRLRPLSGWAGNEGILLAEAPPFLEPDPHAPDPLHDFTRDEWVLFSGTRPQTRSSPTGDTVLATTPSAPTRLATANAIPIQPARRYELEMRIRQNLGSTGINYLGIGWYQNSDRHLAANASAPEGAGLPAGWVNGSMSHFGLVGQPGRNEWTVYRRRFGPGEEGVIPAAAEKIRIIALLNDNAAANTTVELAGVFLRPLPEPSRTFVVGHTPGVLFTPGSQMGLISGHWNSHKTALDFGASEELLQAAGF